MAPKTPKLLVLGLLLAVSGCCLGTDLSSGTGQEVGSTSGGIAASSGTSAGTTAGSVTGNTATGTTTGAGNGTSSGTGTTTGAGNGTSSGTGTTTTGTGGAGGLLLSPNPIAFGYVGILSPSIGCTTATDDSDAPITITGVASFATEGGAFEVATTDDAHPPNPFSFPITIGAGDHARICFTFTCPISQQFQGQATLVTDDPSGTNPVVLLTGWCGGPQISCSPLTLAFGQVAVGQTSSLPVTCTNIGTALPGLELTIGPLAPQGAAFSAAFDTSINPYPQGGLAPGQQVQIDVTYAPIDQSTNDFGVLAITNNGGQGQTPYVSLFGG